MFPVTITRHIFGPRKGNQQRRWEFRHDTELPFAPALEQRFVYGRLQAEFTLITWDDGARQFLVEARPDFLSFDDAAEKLAQQLRDDGWKEVGA